MKKTLFLVKAEVYDKENEKEEDFYTIVIAKKNSEAVARMEEDLYPDYEIMSITAVASEKDKIDFFKKETYDDLEECLCY